MQTDRPQIAVGAIVVRDGKLLMVRRATPPAEGLWTVPGGRVEKGEYLADALRREVCEETGIDVEVGQLLGILEVLGDPHFVILDHLATTTTSDDPVAGDDAAEVRWVALDAVKHLRCTPRFVETLTSWGVLGGSSQHT